MIKPIARGMRQNAHLLLLCTMAVLITFTASGQGKRGVQAAAKPQGIDQDYSAKIKEYTTDPKFSTDLVDHLPASNTVPTPAKILGYPVGAPGKLTYTKDLYRYYHALADASPRVKMWTVGKSEEGRDFVLIAVSDEANIKQIDALRQITAKLADPRHITDAEAQHLIETGKPFYWASGSIHSPETGSPEMLMELAYRLAVDESPRIQNIRKNTVVLITPVLEVDGRDREVDTYNYHLENPNKATPNLVYWGHYVAHDNNRDGIAQALQLSKVQMKNFLNWHPQVLHDLHESVPFLYISTGTGPYNAWLDPIVIDEWQKMAYYEIEQMTERGVPGVWTHGYYDGWAPNYMFYFANGHNSIGRFYETFGNGNADTRERTVPATVTAREWYRPNPPEARVKWSLRNNVNMQESAILFALTYTAERPQEFLSSFYVKSKRSVAKAMTEGPAAWVIQNDGKRPANAAQLAALLQQEGCEVQKLDADLTVKLPEPVRTAGGGGGRRRGSDSGAPAPAPAGPSSVTIKAGSYVIRMDQPYSRIADMLLDTQYYNTNDPRPYDDTGWTLGPLRNVATVRVTDQAVLKAPMTLLQNEAKAAGSVSGSGTKYFIVNANAEPAVATFRYRFKDVKMFAAEEAFEADGTKYNAGTLLIPTNGNPSGLHDQFSAAASEIGIRVASIDSEPSVKRHESKAARIALVHTWVNTQNEGWYRLGLDEMKVPFTYISDQYLRDNANLREKFDVILFPPVGGGNLQSLINGVPKRIAPDGTEVGGPIPWKHTELTPNLVTADGSPDQTDDMRGGMGFEGLAHLKKFVEDGGVFLCFSTNSVLPIELGITSGVSISETRTLQAHGSVYQTNVEDRTSPIAYGYDDKLGVYFSQAPVFHVSLLGGAGGGGGGGGIQPPAAGPRATGRGSLTDPDVIQGRPYETPAANPIPENPRERELYIDPDVRQYSRSTIPPESLWPRVVVRFAEERSLLISGELAGGQELANTPAVVDVPVGRGHVVLYAINPMWRQETQGSFMLVMNAAMNFDHLGAGRASK
jgi:Zinc carboxypeptidase